MSYSKFPIIAITLVLYITSLLMVQPIHSTRLTSMSSSCINGTVSCSMQGECDASNSTCICNIGFTGDQCHKQMNVSILSNIVPDLYFNIQSSLIAEALIEPLDEVDSFSFLWTIEEITSSGTKQVNMNSLLSAGGVNLAFIRLKPNSLKSKKVYKVTLSMWLTTHPLNMVSNSIIFNSSIPPDNGTLNASPKQGIFLVDSFTFEASDWKSTEPNHTLEYRFGFEDRLTKEVIFFNSFSSSNTIKVSLPMIGPTGVVVECRSASGHSLQQRITVVAQRPSPQKLSNSIATKKQVIKTSNSTELESELTTLSSAIDSIVEILGTKEGRSLISDLIGIIGDRKEIIGTAKIALNTKLLSNELDLLDKESVTKLSNILIDAMKEHDGPNILSDVISAANNFASVMIAEKSDKEEKTTFLNLLKQVSSEVRSQLYEGEQKRLSLANVEVVMARTSTANPNVTLSIPIPTKDQYSQNRAVVDSTNVVVQASTSYLTEKSSEISVQGQILANPTETYITKCDTTLVSPTVSVQLFSGQGQNLVTNFDKQVPIISTTMDVSESISSVSNITYYSYFCKYFETSNETWVLDTSVCKTVVIPGSTSVTCLCHEPVTHAVSLDYVQSATGDDKSVTGNSCINPCECNPKKKLQHWTKAVIGIAVSAVFVIVLLILGVVAYIVLMKTISNRSLEKKIEQRSSTSP